MSLVLQLEAGAAGQKEADVKGAPTTWLIDHLSKHLTQLETMPGQRVDTDHGHCERDVSVGTRNCAFRRCLMSPGKHGASYFQVKRTIFNHLPLQQSLRCLTFCTLGATGARKLFLESHEVVRDLLDD